MKNECIFNSYAPLDTLNIAEKLATYLTNGNIVCLNGDLGVGKTILSKGIIKALGVFDIVTSPTFTIVNEYYGKFNIYHFDVYRINDPYEMYDIGFDEYIMGDGISIIEWGNLIKEILPNDYLEILIEKDLNIGEDYRRLIFKLHGSKYERIRSWFNESSCS